MGQKVRLLVADAEEVATVGLRVLLARQAWVERCLQATDGTRALALAQRYCPHVAIVGVTLDDGSAAELCQRISAVSPSSSVLLMGSARRVCARTVAAAQASGFISKHWSVDEMIAAIRVASLGMNVTNGHSPGAAKILTAREEDVIAHIAHGATNTEIADQLHLSIYTVKQHASASYKKLDARNRTEAVEHARRLGIIG